MLETNDLSEIRRIYQANPEDVAMCQELAKKPHLPFKVLEGMAESKNPAIVVLAAVHPELHGSFIQKLSKHPDVSVRCAIAQNRSLGSATFKALTHDPSPLVRLELARNPKLTLQAQTILSEDEVPFVRAELLTRKKLDSEILFALCTDKDLTVHVKALLYPQMPPEQLRRWAENGNKFTLLALAHRKNLPDEIKEILRSRGDQQVRDALDVQQKTSR